jgi:hypothetical protein
MNSRIDPRNLFTYCIIFILVIFSGCDEKRGIEFNDEGVIERIVLSHEGVSHELKFWENGELFSFETINIGNKSSLYRQYNKEGFLIQKSWIYNAKAYYSKFFSESGYDSSFDLDGMSELPSNSDLEVIFLDKNTIRLQNGSLPIEILTIECNCQFKKLLSVEDDYSVNNINGNSLVLKINVFNASDESIHNQIISLKIPE